MFVIFLVKINFYIKTQNYLIACETLGYVNNIVSDQTGIFTKNKLTVSSLFLEEIVYTSVKNIELVNKETLQLVCEW